MFEVSQDFRSRLGCKLYPTNTEPSDSGVSILCQICLRPPWATVTNYSGLFLWSFVVAGGAGGAGGVDSRD